MRNKKYTFRSLVERMEKNGDNLAMFTVGQMMDFIGDETEEYPMWGDIAPEWVVELCLGGYGK